MSKNLTRKGLAFGAIVALGASLLNAAPAFAADELTLVPNTGTAYKTIEGETFKLLTGLAPATPAGNTVQLKYQVVSSATVTAGVNEVTPSAATTAVVVNSTTTVYKQATTPVVGATQTLNLAVTSAVASGTPATAAVTAFFDANNNDALDAGEFTSSARTVTWVDAADVVATITVDALTVGDTTASASLSFKDLNNSQIPKAHVGLYFTQNDSATPSALAGLASTVTGGTAPFGLSAITSAAAATTASDVELLTYSTTKDAFLAKTKGFTAVTSTVNSTLKVQALYLVTGAGVITPAVTNVIGTAATSVAVARTINSVDVVASGATGVKGGAAVQAVPGTAGSLAVAANNSKGTVVTLVATVKDSASTPAVVANAAFKVTVTSATAFSATNSLKINDTTYVAAVPAALDATTDAAGQMTLTLTNATALTAGTVTLAIAGQNITNTVTVTYAAPTYSIVDLADVAGSAGRTIVKGAAYKLDYKVLDQFGDAPAAASTAYRLVNTVTGGNSGTYYATLAADGTASFSFTNNSTAAATSANSIAVTSSTDNFANSTTVLAGATVTTVVVVATAAEATAKTIAFGTVAKAAGQASLGAITQTAPAAATFAGTGTLSEAAFAGYDGRTAKTSAPALGKGYTTAPVHTAGAWTAGVAGTAGQAAITIPVTVKDSTLAAAAVDGASVTVAGKGLMFVVTDAVTAKTIYGVDTLTFLANAGGSSVDVYSHVTGEQSIVFTSGAATATQKITFANYGTEVAAVALGTLAAQAQAGSTLPVSAVATDKWGNVVANVQVGFSTTGAGYLQDTAVQVTDSKGAVAGRVIVLQNDLGTSFITATAAKAKTLLSADLASAKSVEFGLVDADVVSGGKRVFVNAEFAKGRTITVTIDGKRIYSKVQTTDNAVELAFTQKKKGAHTVTVRVSGGIVFTEKVTTN